MKILVTGGVRSGKSTHAETLLSPTEPVRYIAPGQPADPERDPEWAARVALHQRRRPEPWVTIETHDVPPVLLDEGPVLFDCLGTWLTTTLDRLEAWDEPEEHWRPTLEKHIDELARAWADGPATGAVVTNEVGWGLVSEHRSGRIFTDWLGRTNQAIAAASDEVHLVVAGRVITL